MMNFNPLLHASLAIQIHVATVVPAFFLGAWQIFLSRGPQASLAGSGKATPRYQPVPTK
jgi:uncharacterized membrane protein